MSTVAQTNIAKFVDLVRNDPVMQTQIVNARDADAQVEKVVQIAEQRGISVTADEIRSHVKSQLAGADSSALSDKELHNVVGGIMGDGTDKVTALANACIGSTSWSCYAVALGIIKV